MAQRLRALSPRCSKGAGTARARSVVASDANRTGTIQVLAGASGGGLIRKDEGFLSSSAESRFHAIRPTLLPRTAEEETRTSR